jgi:hypothetical protein
MPLIRIYHYIKYHQQSATSSDGLQTIVPGFLRLRKAEYDEGSLEYYLAVSACVDPEQKEGASTLCSSDAKIAAFN